MPDLSAPAGWLPVVFVLLMGISMLAYVVLDGYDLGVGILLRRAADAEKDLMIASIGPFWDANETGSCSASASCSSRFRWRTA
jgi:cytochrome d ubiquinol oxidase subunit II